MLKIETEKGHISELVVKGNIIDITSDILLMFSVIYDILKARDTEVAEYFKEFCITDIDKAFMSNEELINATLDKYNKLEEFKKAFGLGEE